MIIDIDVRRQFYFIAYNVPQLYLVGFFSPLNKGDVSS